MWLIHIMAVGNIVLKALYYHYYCFGVRISLLTLKVKCDMIVQIFIQYLLYIDNILYMLIIHTKLLRIIVSLPIFQPINHWVHFNDLGWWKTNFRVLLTWPRSTPLSAGFITDRITRTHANSTKEIMALVEVVSYIYKAPLRIEARKKRTVTE